MKVWYDKIIVLQNLFSMPKVLSKIGIIKTRIAKFILTFGILLDN